MIDDEFNWTVRQTRGKNYLNSLVYAIKKEGTNISPAIAKFYRFISKISPQVPHFYRGEQYTLEFVSNAKVEYIWSREPLSLVATHGLTFQMVYEEFEAAL